MTTTLLNGMPKTIPDSATHRWLLAYDIRDPKRLKKVWRVMRREGIPFQYSLYFLRSNKMGIENLLQRLTTLIDTTVDDLRVYPLGENTRMWGLGNQFDEGGNALCDEVLDRLRQPSKDRGPSPILIHAPLGSTGRVEDGDGSFKSLFDNDFFD